ncbi:hypothetical protein ABEP17_18260 [Priestia flexa]|jgi:hypothetical protein|uniref:Uncharacterized protein n=1 Tax=Priestia flexa TaxID=86664 RepID=A0ABU4J4D6_9BACI|nr:hypothetical protein [Priestia flexa]MDW8515849.1 hypothetical protein [Priestia flexa]
MNQPKMNKPSKEAIRNMLEFFARTSVPRIMAAREKERVAAKQFKNSDSNIEIKQ